MTIVPFSGVYQNRPIIGLANLVTGRFMAHFTDVGSPAVPRGSIDMAITRWCEQGTDPCIWTPRTPAEFSYTLFERVQDA